MEELCHWEGNIQNGVYIYLSDLLRMEMQSGPWGLLSLCERSLFTTSRIMVCMGGSPATPPGPTAERIRTKGLEEWFSHKVQPRDHTHISNTQPAFVYRTPRSCAGVYR